MCKCLCALLSGIFLLCIVFGCAGLAVVSLSADYVAYRDVFHACADTAAMGVLPAQYDAIAQALSTYFAGQSDTPQVQIVQHDAPAPAFNARELAHLSDVRALMQHLHTAACFMLGVAIVIFLLACILRTRSARQHLPVRSILYGFAGALLLLCLVLCWALLDFNSLFVLMHRLLFTNDLWLMDPQTDLIISLMPQAFFTAMAGKLLRRLALMLLRVALVIQMLLILIFKKSGQPI